MAEKNRGINESGITIDVVGLHSARKKISKIETVVCEKRFVEYIVNDVQSAFLNILGELKKIDAIDVESIKSNESDLYNDVLYKSMNRLTGVYDDETSKLSLIINCMDDMRNRLCFMDMATASHFDFLDQLDNYGENFANDDDGSTYMDEEMISIFDELQSKPRNEWTDYDYRIFNECISYDPNLVYSSLKVSFEAIMSKPRSKWTAQDMEIVNQYLYYETAVIDPTGRTAMSFVDNMGEGAPLHEDRINHLLGANEYTSERFDKNGVWIPRDEDERRWLIEYLGYDPGSITREVFEYASDVWKSRRAANSNRYDVYNEFTKATGIADEYWREHFRAEFGPLYDVYNITGTVTCGLVSGGIRVVENIVDGVIILGGGLAAYAFDAADYSDIAQEIRNTTAAIIQPDVSQCFYDVTTYFMDPMYAQSMLGEFAQAGGVVGGYWLLNTVTGGGWQVAAGAVAAAGSSAETGFNIVGVDGEITEDEYNAVWLNSAGAAVAGGGSAYVGNKFGDLYKATGNGMYLIGSVGVAMSEPVVNTAVGWMLYVDDDTDFWTYAAETDMFDKMFMAAATEYLSGTAPTESEGEAIKYLSKTVDEFGNAVN